MGIYLGVMPVLNLLSDPRLHFASIHRNPSNCFVKWFFCVAMLAHHSGSAMLIVDLVMNIVNQLPPMKPCDLDLPVIGIALRELRMDGGHQGAHTHGIVVVLPLQQACVVGQVSRVLCFYAFFDSDIPECTLWASVFGSVGGLMATLSGCKTSTWEEDTESCSRIISRSLCSEHIESLQDDMLAHGQDLQKELVSEASSQGDAADLPQK